MTSYERKLRRQYWIFRALVYASIADSVQYVLWMLDGTVSHAVGSFGLTTFSFILSWSWCWYCLLGRRIATTNVATLPSAYVMRVLRKEVVCPDKSRLI
jgi:hypothetical protein